MKQLPRDPFAFQRRIMSAMCDDLFDMGAGKSTRFERLDALRAVSRQTPNPTPQGLPHTPTSAGAE